MGDEADDRSRDELFRRVFEASGYAGVLANKAGTILAANKQARVMLGYAEAELIGASIEMLMPRVARKAHVHQRAAYHAEPHTKRMGSGRDLEAQRRDGTRVPVEIALNPVQWAGETLVMAALVDISLRKEAERNLLAMAAELHAANDRLDSLAATDPLTGLWNRRGLARQLFASVADASRTGARAMALLIDCDDFKSVNDRLGHAAGDEVLKSVADAIASAVRPGDLVARIGGDEFLVVVPHTREAEARMVAERIRRRTASTPLPVGDGVARTTVSIGVAPIPPNLASLQELLTGCEQLLKQSKVHGKNRVSGHGDVAEAGMDIAGALIEGRGLVAVSQPIVILETGAEIGSELLTRWPGGPLEMPDDFFGAAREHNVLTAVDLACLRVCAAAASGFAARSVAHLNIHPSTLLATSPEQLLELLAPCIERRLELTIEVSEQQFVGDPSCLRPVAKAIRDAGLHLAIDDVGYGRSSLEALILLEADVVKIDRRYIAGCDKSPGLRNALSRLLRVVKALGARAIAEGVETQAEVDVLGELGVPYAQGYFFGHPRPIRTITTGSGRRRAVFESARAESRE